MPSEEHTAQTSQEMSPDKSHDCEFCGDTFYEPIDTPGPQYMWEGHIIMECSEVPDDVRRWYNDPTYDGDSDAE